MRRACGARHRAARVRARVPRRVLLVDVVGEHPAAAVISGRATFGHARPIPPHRRRLRSTVAPTVCGEEALAAENRLTVEQLAALAPGDVVTIESGEAFGRRRYCTGTVARTNRSYLTVASKSVGGAKHVEQYSLRDGFRLGGGCRAELVKAQPDELAARDLLLRQTRQIDVLYRTRSRRRDDVEALRELHAAICQHLEAADAEAVIRA